MVDVFPSEEGPAGEVTGEGGLAVIADEDEDSFPNLPVVEAIAGPVEVFLELLGVEGAEHFHLKNEVKPAADAIAGATEAIVAIERARLAATDRLALGSVFEVEFGVFSVSWITKDIGSDDRAVFELKVEMGPVGKTVAHEGGATKLLSNRCALFVELLCSKGEKAA